MSLLMRSLRDIRLWAGLTLIVFQYWILVHPQPPLLARPVHLVLALFLVFLWNPLRDDKLPVWAGRAIDGLILAAVVGFAVYYWLSITRIEERIENVSPVFAQDTIFGIIFVLLLLEGVRRTTGWILVWVILAFLAYGAFAFVLPIGGFRGFRA